MSDALCSLHPCQCIPAVHCVGAEHAVLTPPAQYAPSSHARHPPSPSRYNPGAQLHAFTEELPAGEIAPSAHVPTMTLLAQYEFAGQTRHNPPSPR
eukprot:915711-Rhodomonas_salina.1